MRFYMEIYITMEKPYKFEYSKTSFEELSKEERQQIEILCTMISHSSAFEHLFNFLINSHVSECILEDIENTKKGIEPDKHKQIN